MTVAELRARLADLPADMLVIVASDGEGNGYSPLYCLDQGGHYEPYSTWSGTVHHQEDLEEDEEEMPENSKPCVVLCPVN